MSSGQSDGGSTEKLAKFQRVKIATPERFRADVSLRILVYCEGLQRVLVSGKRSSEYLPCE